MLKKYIVVVVAIAVVIGASTLITSKSDSDTNSSNTSSQVKTEPNTVPIKNVDYVVKELTVKKGTTVTWRNDDTAQHDVVFDDASMSAANSPGLLKKGQQHKYTFDEVGIFNYHCTPHQFMKAKIIVKE